VPLGDESHSSIRRSSEVSSDVVVLPPPPAPPMAISGRVRSLSTLTSKLMNTLSPSVQRRHGCAIGPEVMKRSLMCPNSGRKSEQFSKETFSEANVRALMHTEQYFTSATIALTAGSDVAAIICRKSLGASRA
jgi:hypothetical protein